MRQDNHEIWACGIAVCVVVSKRADRELVSIAIGLLLFFGERRLLVITIKSSLKSSVRNQGGVLGITIKPIRKSSEILKAEYRSLRGCEQARGKQEHVNIPYGFSVLFFRGHV